MKPFSRCVLLCSFNLLDMLLEVCERLQLLEKPAKPCNFQKLEEVLKTKVSYLLTGITLVGEFYRAGK